MSPTSPPPSASAISATRRSALAGAALAGAASTLVVPLREDSKIASIVTAGLSTIAPAGAGASSDAGAPAGQPPSPPLAAPSANASGRHQPDPRRACRSPPRWRIPLVDRRRPPCERGIESTIIAATNGDSPPPTAAARSPSLPGAVGNRQSGAKGRANMPATMLRPSPSGWAPRMWRRTNF